jgi:hypothetical protein
VTRVEIQSGSDAALPEALSGTFQLCDDGEVRGWCVGAGAAPSTETTPASSEGRRG